MRYKVKDPGVKRLSLGYETVCVDQDGYLPPSASRSLIARFLQLGVIKEVKRVIRKKEEEK